jgi:hypothetical protein
MRAFATAGLGFAVGVIAVVLLTPLFGLRSQTAEYTGTVTLVECRHFPHNAR